MNNQLVSLSEDMKKLIDRMHFLRNFVHTVNPVYQFLENEQLFQQMRAAQYTWFQIRSSRFEPLLLMDELKLFLTQLEKNIMVNLKTEFEKERLNIETNFYKFKKKGVPSLWIQEKVDSKQLFSNPFITLHYLKYVFGDQLKISYLNPYGASYLGLGQRQESKKVRILNSKLNISPIQFKQPPSSSSSSRNRIRELLQFGQHKQGTGNQQVVNKEMRIAEIQPIKQCKFQIMKSKLKEIEKLHDDFRSQRSNKLSQKNTKSYKKKKPQQENKPLLEENKPDKSKNHYLKEKRQQKTLVKPQKKQTIQKMNSGLQEVGSKPQQMKHKPKEVEEKLQEMDFKLQENENKPQEVEDKLQEVLFKPQKMKHKPKEVEEKLQEMDFKLQENENKPQEVEDKLQEVLFKPQKMKHKPKEVEEKLQEMDFKLQENENKPQEVEDKLQEVLFKPQKMKHKPKEVEEKLQEMDFKLQENENKPQEVEDKLQEVLFKPQKMKHKPKEVEEKLQEMDFKLQENENKPQEVEDKLQNKPQEVQHKPQKLNRPEGQQQEFEASRLGINKRNSLEKETVLIDASVQIEVQINQRQHLNSFIQSFQHKFERRFIKTYRYRKGSKVNFLFLLNHFLSDQQVGESLRSIIRNSALYLILAKMDKVLKKLNVKTSNLAVFNVRRFGKKQ